MTTGSTPVAAISASMQRACHAATVVRSQTTATRRPARSVECIEHDRGYVLRQRLDREPLTEELVPAFAETGSECFVVREGADRVGERLGVAGRAQERLLA